MGVLTCLYCGEPEHVEVFEVYSDGAFQLHACCEGMHEAVSEHLAEDPKAAARWLAGLRDPDLQACGVEAGVEDLCGHELRRVVDDGCGQLLLDWNLEIVPVSLAQAKAFIREHHKHCRPPAGWRFGAGVRNGRQLVAVVTVGRPVARAIDHNKVVEVNRLCVRRDVPQDLVWNACSSLYGWSAREAKRRGFERIITYTLESEPGTTLRAVGWAAEAVVRGRRRGWDSPARPRGDNSPKVNKTRWAKDLLPMRRQSVRPALRPVSAVALPVQEKHLELPLAA